MGQAEILILLNKNRGKMFSVEQISKELDVRTGSIYQALKSLRGREVSFKREKISTFKNKIKYLYWIDISGRVITPDKYFGRNSFKRS